MKTEKAYKLLKINKNGQLFPLYVLANKETPVGEWIPAESGELQANGKVKAKLGDGLCYRPGWHLAEVPFADWIGERQADGTLARRKDNVWCEVEYPTDIDYNPEAFENGKRTTKKGETNVESRRFLRHIPENGYYNYRTQAAADVWIITGAIKITKVLTDDEVAEICRAKGIEPQEVAK